MADQLLTSSAVTGSATPVVTSYSYDGNGNQLSSAGPTGTTNTFNAQDQLVQVSGPSTTLSLVYDGQGDRLGSVRLAIDPMGATIGAGAHDAWGDVMPCTGPDGATQLARLQASVPFGYAGQQYDAESGTYAMWARTYDPLAPTDTVPVTLGSLPVRRGNWVRDGDPSRSSKALAARGLTRYH